ncbi:MAG TPA: hypothetical protein VMX17_15810 [Candidatus Glassbacteria bacterium]|nr:hypothetical protein [Candidatus Glassbacteria bacterium]
MKSKSRKPPKLRGEAGAFYKKKDYSQIYCLRIAVVELCGWATKKGHATAAKRILTKHGIEK